jgi:Undecaprenyl-phosphate glucose phosphotransferase
MTTTSAILCGRFVIAAFVSRWAKSGLLRRNILIYGAGEQGKRLLEYVSKRNEPWTHIVGVFDDRLSRTDPEVAGFPYLGDLRALVEYGNKNSVDEVVLTLPWSANTRILKILTLLAPLPVNVKLSPELAGFEMATRRTSREFGIPMLEILEKPLSGWKTAAKAVIDFTVGALFTLAALPLMLLIALCIKMESKGPVFFVQKRYGFKNQLIEILKFRTMYAEDSDYDATRLTERNDPRVTRVGAVLRRWSLDELPQLLNVMSGEMSVVGPRPHAVSAKAGGRLYEEVVDEYAVRHKVKPGITGWAQVNGWRGNTDTEQALIKRVEHDLYYIENWTITFDIKIIIMTAWSIINGKNSY